MTTTQTPPQENRATATTVGVLFIIATVVYLLAGAIYAPSTAPADYLARAYPDRTTISFGVVLEFACVLATACSTARGSFLGGCRAGGSSLRAGCSLGRPSSCWPTSPVRSSRR